MHNLIDSEIARENIFKNSSQLFLPYGCIIKIGEEKATPESVIKVLESKDRTKSGKTAPAEGLYLYNVEY